MKVVVIILVSRESSIMHDNNNEVGSSKVDTHRTHIHDKDKS